MLREFSQALYGRYERTVHYELKSLGARQQLTLRQFSLLPRVLNHQERRSALALVILVIVSSSFLAWRWYDRHTVRVPTVGGEYAEAILGTPRTANPLLASNDAERDLAELTYRGLFRNDDSATVVPDLAQSWTTSPDQKTYRITLLPNLRWSDGQPLTADDVAFTFQSLRDTALASPAASGFQGVVVKQEDQLTTTFTLAEPYAPFLSALTIGLVPAHIWRSTPPQEWRGAETNLNPVGTGPFRTVAINHDRQGNLRSITLEPNPFTHTAQPYLTRIVLKYYPDTTTALAALRDGSADALGGLTRSATVAVSELRFRQYELKLPQYTAVFYNVGREGILASRAVRQALGYAINRQQLIRESLGGGAVPANGPFPFGETKARAAGYTSAYNPQRTDELLQQAGYRRPDSTSPYQKDGAPITFTLTAADSEEQATIASALKQQWAAAGITVTLDLVPRDRLQAEIIPQRNFEALLARELTGFDPDPYPFWHSSQTGDTGLNLANFKHHDADTLLEEARQDSSWEHRVERYAKFQEIISQESPASFLYSVSYSYIVNRTLTVTVPTAIANPADRFRALGSWYSGTERRFTW